MNIPGFTTQTLFELHDKIWECLRKDDDNPSIDAEDFMKVKELKPHIDHFINFPGGRQPVSAEFSRPWHFNFCKGEQIPLSVGNGVYLYTKPATPDWNLPFEENAEDVWYIGKSEGDIGGRVWHHTGRTFEPGSQDEICNPRFKYHSWKDAAYVPDSIKNQIATGDLVVYVIQIKSELKMLAPALEKYLLVVHLRLTGELPILNMQL